VENIGLKAPYWKYLSRDTKCQEFPRIHESYKRAADRNSVREIKSDIAARIRSATAIETARSQAGMRNDRGTGKPNNTKFLRARI